MPAKRILIADDDSRLLSALSVRLKAEGFEVITSQDGYQAVDFARRHRPDLIVLDVNMPAGSGFSVQERIAKIDELAGVRIIYITGETPGSIDHAVQQSGAFSVVYKPFKPGQLIKTIRAALERPPDSRIAA